MQQDSKIYVAGHTGLIGSAIVRKLAEKGFINVIIKSHCELDLKDGQAVREFFSTHRPEYVFLAAGKVGGIMENKTYPADFIETNLAIQMNVMTNARDIGVRKLVFFGSSCMYPRECPQPMHEEMLMTGKPEPTSIAYAMSKLAGVEMCLSFNRQSGGLNFIPVIPNSAYGPNDNFNPNSGHVLSVLIRRFHDAKTANDASITLWGTGIPKREFIHADDIADASVFLVSNQVEAELPINIGVGKDYSIKELAGMIANVVGYKGLIDWDTTKPDGAPRKLLDSTRMLELGWRPAKEFEEGLVNTYQWFLENAAN